MSMVINLVEDHNIYLCEGGPVYNGSAPTPITYLTQWKIVGNSEVHGTEIWSCGEYNATDGKYHILVQPLGGSIADIALTEPLRKVNNVADTIEFPSGTEGKALVTRNFYQETITKYKWFFSNATKRMYCRFSRIKAASTNNIAGNILFPTYPTISNSQSSAHNYGICVTSPDGSVCIYDENYQDASMIDAFKEHISELELLYELATPTTELVDVPQIAEADSYTCVISQGGKAVSWSEFIYTSDYLLTDSENNILADSENYQLTVQS